MGKELILMAAICLGTSLGRASVEIPGDFFPDFATEGLEGWTVYGDGHTPAAGYAGIFADSSYALLPWSGGTAAFSCSESEDGGTSDQWLVSPEFEVTGDNMVLYYTVVTRDNTLNNKYSIMISDGGSDKSDFKVLANNVVKGDNGGEGYVSRRQALKGYEGKHVRIALVNTGNSKGLLGFADIGVASYYLHIDRAGVYDNLVVSDSEAPMHLSLSLSTAVKSQGFTARLRAGDFESVYTSEKICNLNTMASADFSFPDSFDFVGERDFTVTITPGYENAPASVLSGKVIVAEPVFPKAVLIEEMTSTRCSYCPRGTAFLEYFADKYDGGSNTPRVIGVALHNNMNMADPMVISGNSYRTDLLAAFPSIDGLLPNAVYNRTATCDPSMVPVEELVKSNSVARASIRRVDYDRSAGNTVSVDFDAEISYTIGDAAIDASVIVTENNLSGNGMEWAQSNAFANNNMAQVIDTYGAELVPYFEPFIGTADPIAGFVYNDVARGVFPSFRGSPLEGDFTAMTPREFNISFEMPDNVSDPANTQVILVLTSRSSGEVVGADIISADRYNSDLSVTEPTPSARLSAHPVAEGIEIYAERAASVTVCAADGTLLFAGNVDEGRSVIPCRAEGMLIVGIAAPDGNTTIKMVK